MYGKIINVASNQKDTKDTSQFMIVFAHDEGRLQSIRCTEVYVKTA